MLLGINTHQYLLRLLVQMYTLIVSTVLIFTLPEYSSYRTLINWKMGFTASYHSYHSYHSSRVQQMKMELQDLEELGNGSRSFSVPNVSLVSMNHSFTFEMFLWRKKNNLISTQISNIRSTLQVITYSGMAVAALMLVQSMNMMMLC